MLFALLNDRYPYHSEDDEIFLREQKNPNFLPTRYIKQFPADLLHLITSLLTVDETKRMTINKVAKHPWIKRGGK